MKVRKIVVVDDHPLFREALSSALSERLADASVSEAATSEELSTLLERVADVELVLFGVSMPGAQALAQLSQLRARHPDARLVAVAPQQDPLIIRNCMEIGVAGFIPKSLGADDIVAAVERVLQGETWAPPCLQEEGDEEDDIADLTERLATLTPQQVRVLVMLSEGLLNKQIAFQLGVSEATVKAHVSAILQKLGVNSRTQAVIAVNRLENRDWQSSAH